MKQEKKPVHTSPSKATLKKPSGDLYARVNGWFDKHDKKWPYIFGAFCLLYSLLLFNARISEANDDSLYIEAAYKYSENFFSYFYTANAPLYPMLLSLPVSIFGINLIALKLVSTVFNFLQLFFLYKTFKNRFPNLVFYPTIFILAINNFILYYSSMTYSESFFMFLQALLFFYFLKLYDQLESGETELKKTYKLWLAVGLVLTLLTFTRSISVVVLPAIFVMFILFKQYRYALHYSIVVVAFKILFESLKSLIWGKMDQFSTQAQMLLQKDPYDSTAGLETFGGFVMRFINNSELYLSKRFFQIIGFMDETSTTTNGFVTILVFALLILGGIQLFLNKDKKMLVTLFYSFAIMIGSFVILQASWDQARIIMVVIPLLLLILFYGLYQVTKKSPTGRNIYICFVIIVCTSVFISSTKRSVKNMPILVHNLKGDIYYGYTNDWINYLKMSAWCADSLPSTSKVACRKAPMSFIYGKGHFFYPVYKVFAVDSVTKMANPDSVLSLFKRNNVTHVLAANLRMNPEKSNQQIINTIQRLMSPVAQKYPGKLKLVHTIGESENAELYEIIY
jgi:hypothetical protein